MLRPGRSTLSGESGVVGTAGFGAGTAVFGGEMGSVGDDGATEGPRLILGATGCAGSDTGSLNGDFGVTGAGGVVVRFGRVGLGLTAGGKGSAGVGLVTSGTGSGTTSAGTSSPGGSGIADVSSGGSLLVAGFLSPGISLAPGTSPSPGGLLSSGGLLSAGGVLGSGRSIGAGTSPSLVLSGGGSVEPAESSSGLKNFRIGASGLEPSASAGGIGTELSESRDGKVGSAPVAAVFSDSGALSD